MTDLISDERLRELIARAGVVVGDPGEEWIAIARELLAAQSAAGGVGAGAQSSNARNACRAGSLGNKLHEMARRHRRHLGRSGIRRPALRGSDRGEEGMSKPILCLDFDGVLHSYTSGWQGADIIPDPPVDQMATFLAAAVGEFRVAIYSSRSHQPGGIDAMRFWLRYWLCMVMDLPDAEKLLAVIEFPNYKPSAMVTLDDRAITFTGTFPPIDKLRAFKPWNKP